MPYLCPALSQQAETSAARTTAEIGASSIASASFLQPFEVQIADRKLLVEDVVVPGVRPLLRLVLMNNSPGIANVSAWHLSQMSEWLGKPLDFNVLGVLATEQVGIDLTNCQADLKNLCGQTSSGQLALSF